MDRLTEATELNRSGLFREALLALENSDATPETRSNTTVLKAELLERVGRRSEAHSVVRRILAWKSLSWTDRSRCDFVLARIAVENGENRQAIEHLNRSINAAARAGNTERMCLAQLKLLLLLSDGSTRDATGPLLAEVRAGAMKAGDPILLATIHVYFAQIEGYRSSVTTARRHIRLAQSILSNHPNAWLSAVISNVELSLALLASEFEVAKTHAIGGRILAERSGGSEEFAVNEGNAGYVLQALGEYDEAIASYHRALNHLAPGSEPHNAILDSLARVRLGGGQLVECEALLNQIDLKRGDSARIGSFVSRNVQLTRALYYMRAGDCEAAREYIGSALRLSRDARDLLLTMSALLEKGRLSLIDGDVSAAKSAAREVACNAHGHSAFLFGRFQEFVADVLRAEKHTHDDYRSRAERVYTGLHHKEALRDLSARRANDDNAGECASNATCSLVQSIAGAFSFLRHAEFAGVELFNVLLQTGVFPSLRVLLRHHDGRVTVLSSHGPWPEEPLKDRLLRQLQVGETLDGVVELLASLSDDLNCAITFEALAFLTRRARELEVADAERKERSTLWPDDDTAFTDGDKVISGHLRELMTFAQRVARTNVNVLITGESGTGKEILARAIHEFSERAHKPFVPFNCAAVPRDLLESQLFGHRRGAFTGAERDQLGLIRSATDGTLFLDEVGEMSLDLQPKLLRFLESGEIAPLGEPSPFTVSVRVVAATNANIEDAVRDGKFREDLFYRLNVVRLSIKPLRERRDEIPGMVTHFVAAAAREYKKGHLQVSEDTMERLLLFRWPGNVRQLQNEVRRMVALAEPNSTLEPDSMSPAILGAMPDLRRTSSVNGRELAVPLDEKLVPTLTRIEYEMVKAALRTHRGRVDPAAKSLGISRKGLYLKRQRLGL